MTRDLQLALRAKRAGAKNSLRIVWEARRAGIPISWAFALVDQETGFRNVFGHDKGSIFPGEAVTKRRVKRLILHVRGGGISNGVGFTQLTSLFLIEQAEELGGAHIVKNQLRVGFRFFRDVTHSNPDRLAWRYNGAKSYQAKIKAKQRRWHKVLT